MGCGPDLHDHEPMDSIELRRCMRKLSCHGHLDLANLIGVSRPAVTLWLQGKVKIPKPIAMLLRMMVVEKNRGKTRT